MLIGMRRVTVLAVPNNNAASEEKNFLRMLQKNLETDRPRFVLDCSALRQIDNVVLRVLLWSLEEAMKRNGDVRLAALHPTAQAALAAAGVDRLFEIFPSAAEAVHSYRKRSAAVIPPQAAEAPVLGEVENAA
ncbi:MAG: STAS domain-containing protein [Acidobacteriaceae bacterium]|jgi:anti-anti-sigma factor